VIVLTTPTKTPTPTPSPSANFNANITLTSHVSPGSIVIDYTLTSDISVFDDIHVDFTQELNVKYGDIITIMSGLTLNTGDRVKTLQVVVDDDFNRLDGSGIFKNVNINNSGDTRIINVDMNIVFPTPTPTVTLTPTNTPTPTITPTSTSTPTPTPTETPLPPPVTPSNTPTSTPTPTPTPTPGALPTFYYGKINKTTINTGDINDLSTIITNKIVDSHIHLSTGKGYGYILIPETSQQPSLFRNSNQGCSGFIIPMIKQSDITIDLDGVLVIYNVYRTYVLTHSFVDVWLCE